MKRTISVETSQFDPSPKWWNYGCECYMTDVVVEFDEKLDGLDDDELLEIADMEDGRVNYVSL